MSERLYTDLAAWWPLLSPPQDYDEEAVGLLMAAQEALGRAPASWLELGSGAGHLACHLPSAIEVVLVDQAEPMLAVSRSLNPDREHLCGDLRSLRLPRRFDVVLIHDAVMYLADRDALARALETAAAHLEPGGVAIFVPDCTKETFEEGVAVCGVDRGERGARLLEWRHGLDGERFVVDFSVMLRTGNEVEAVHERHTMGVYALTTWTAAIEAAGLTVVGGDAGFVARR